MFIKHYSVSDLFTCKNCYLCYLGILDFNFILFLSIEKTLDCDNLCFVCLFVFLVFDQNTLAYNDILSLKPPQHHPYFFNNE